MRAEPREQSAEPTITHLLSELEHGSRDALDALVPLVYNELQALAHRQRLRWRGEHTMGTTALVHETYCKLVNQDRLVAENRAHFFALASRAMRHILCNYARDRRAMKRGGGYAHVDLDRAGDPAEDTGRFAHDSTPDPDGARLLALNDALIRLERVHPRRSRVVECRFFGGMTVEDTAAALQISARTVKRDWAAAQEWLRREIVAVEQSTDRTAGTLDALAADVLPPLMAAFTQAAEEGLQPGQRVASYEIVARLGHGGMGVVYRAYDTRLDRYVALKFLPSHLADDAAARTRLMYEARAASALDHPNICTIYDIATLDDGRTFLALACYDGRTLKERMAAGPLPEAEVVAIARQVAEGLAAAHRRGIVHRDIKPSNLMLTVDGTAKILDFGIAMVRDRDAMPGRTAGTVAYMSPEHARGEVIDGRTDLWSLGVVVFEMLTGKRPFHGDTDASRIEAICTQPLPALATLRADLPPLLVRVVETCLQKDREARYADADALLADLRAVEAPAGSHGTRARLVAVLPLSSAQAVADDAYLADAVTDELAARLARLSGLHVIARASTRSVMDGERTLAQIAAALGVETIVRGGVRRSGDDVDLSLQLVDVLRNTSLWESEERIPLARLDSTLRTLTWQIAGELAVEVYGDERRRLARRSTDNTAAYTLYLKGRYFWSKRDSASVQQARAHFEQALDLDPVFAQAWGGLADTFCILGSSAQLRPDDAYPRARAAAERALAIDDELPDAHASLATILADYYWSWAAAEAHYRRAIELNPSYATARLWYAGLLRDLGRFDAALVQVRVARTLDPLSAPIQAAEGITLYLARRYPEAIEVYTRLLAITPSFHYAQFLMALAMVQQGDHAAALSALQEAERWIGADAGVRGLAGCAHAALGRPTAARAMLAALEADADQPHATSFQRAVIHAALGEADRALALLGETCDVRSKQVRLLRTEPLFDGIRETPGFQKLLERVGLTDDDVAHALAP